MSWQYFLSNKSGDQPTGIDPYEDEIESDEVPTIVYWLICAFFWIMGNRR